jgi:PAS domain S-box-containing protein
MPTPLSSSLGSRQRLAAPASTGLLDTSSEEQFDRLTRLAAQTLRAPFSAITLVDDRRQLFKSSVGLPEAFRSRRDVPLLYSLCKHVVRTGRPMIVEDARRHRRTRKSPAVEELGMVSYVGVPLRAPSGHVIGSFFVSDSVPRLWTAEEQCTLEDFARIAEDHLANLTSHGPEPSAHDRSAEARKAIEEMFTATALFHVLVDQAVVGVSIVQEGRIRYANPAFAQMFGYTEEEVVALPSVLELVVEEDRASVDERMRTCVEGGVQGSRRQFRGRRKDGSIVHVEVNDSIVQFDGASALVGVLLDTTEREHAKSALEAREERYHRLFDDDLTGNLISTPEGRIVASNPAFVRMFGYESAAEILQTDASRFYADDGAQRDWLTRLRTEGRVEQQESELLRKDGTRMQVLENAIGTFDDTGTLVEIRRYLFDISKRKQAEDVLRRSEEQFRAITENTGDIVHILDEHGVVRYMSPSVEAVLGYTPEEMIGRVGHDLVHPDDRARMDEGFEEAIRQTGAEQAVEVRLRHRDGSWRTAEVRGKVLVDTTGARIAIVNSHDITERMRIQSALFRSEERFRLISRATKDVLWEWNVATGELHWGESAPVVFRYPAANVGSSIEWWVERLHPEDRQRVVSELHHVVHGADESWSSEYRFRRGDGVYATMLDRGYVAREEDGEPARVIGSMMDISERTRSEASNRLLAGVSALLVSSRDLEGVLPAVARAVIPLLADYCLIDQLADEKLFRAAESHIAPDQEALLKDRVPRSLRSFGETDPMAKVLRDRVPRMVPDMAGGLLEPSATDIELRNGSEVLGTHSLMIIPLVVREEVLGVLTLGSTTSTQPYGPLDLLVAQDLGSRIALALENAHLYKAAQQATRDREQLLGVVSHDLRNPLNTIKLSADLLRESNGERRSGNSQWLDMIGRSADEMTYMIEDLLDLSSMDAGGFTVDAADHEVESILNDLCDSFRPLAAHRSITFRCDPGPGHLTAWMDLHRIRRVFSNLLGNALKFTPEGGTITLRAEGPEEEEICFSVSDTGPGIATDQLPHVFDRYWQARKGDRRGAGLGLSIARGIVEAHGGRLWVESTPGEGATFFFTLANGAAEGSLNPGGFIGEPVGAR